MDIKTFKLRDLNPAGYNPRQITKEALDGLSKSLEKFGYLQPIVVNVNGGKNRVISGHQRLKVMLAEGGVEAKCVVVDFDETTEKAANIALNSEAISGDWEPEGLEAILEELKFEFPDFEDVNFDELTKQFDSEYLPNLDEEEGAAAHSQNIVFHECPKCGFKWEK